MHESVFVYVHVCVCSYAPFCSQESWCCNHSQSRELQHLASTSQWFHCILKMLFIPTTMLLKANILINSIFPYYLHYIQLHIHTLYMVARASLSLSLSLSLSVCLCVCDIVTVFLYLKGAKLECFEKHLAPSAS